MQQHSAHQTTAVWGWALGRKHRAMHGVCLEWMRKRDHNRMQTEFIPFLACCRRAGRGSGGMVPAQQFFPSVMLVSPLLFSLGSRLFACHLVVPTHHLLCVLHVSYHIPLIPIYPPHIDWLWPICGIWWYLSHGTRTCDTPVIWQIPLIGPRQDEGKPPAVRRGQLQPSPGGRRRSHRSQRCRKGVFVCMHALGNGNMI